LSYGHPRMATV